MESTPVVFAKLYFPLLLCITAILLLFRARKGGKEILLKLKPLGEFIDIQIPVTNVLVVQAVAIMLVPISLAMYLTYDYTKFFPRDLQMEVFFDQEGLRESLDVFSPTELKGLAIPEDYANYQKRYFESLDSEVQKLLGISRFFGIKKGSAHSTGRVHILVESIEGWQNYYVRKSEGELTNQLEIPESPPRQFYTRFEKLASKDDYISLSLKDIFFRQSVTLRTQYKQIIVENRVDEGVRFKLSLLGATKIKLMPWPAYSNTVYLAEFEGVGRIPIAYAIYR